MKKEILATLALIFVQINFLTAQSLTWQWAYGFGGLSFEEGTAVAVDANDNCYITGRFGNNCQIGSTLLTGHPSYMDAFISKLDNAGNVIWAKEGGGANQDWSYDIALDHLGNSFITGYFNSTANFGGNMISSIGFNDVFIAKYDLNGSVSWIRNFGSSHNDVGRKICTDNANNVYVAGIFQDSIVIGTTILHTVSWQDIFLAKYDNSGNFIWVKRIGGLYDEGIGDLSIDNSNNIYLSGNFAGTLYSGTDSIYSSMSDLFLAKFDGNGNTLWLKDGGDQIDNKNVECTTSTVDNFGNVYVAGDFKDTMYFGTNYTTAYSNNEDAFLCKFDTSGNRFWIVHGGGGGSDIAHSISTDAYGNIYETGGFFGNATFGSVTINNNFNLYASTFLVKYDPAGNALWGLKEIQTIVDCYFLNMTVKDSSLYQIGMNDGAATLGTFTFNGFDYYDILVGKLNGITTNVPEVNINANSFFTIYPNPANNILYTFLSKPENITITNLLGEIMFEKKAMSNSNGKIELNVSKLTTGIYLIKAGNEVRKFVKE
jgi:type IX secretion system substrate protein/beta-propeller repeat-containing protein